MCGAQLVELCDVWGTFGGIVCCVGQSWWNCVICGADLVELCDVWGRVGGIV